MRPAPYLLGSWALLLALVLAAPLLTHPADPGDDLIRYTIRLSLVYYALAAALMVVLRPEEWAAEGWRGQAARRAWTLAWLTYLIHLAMAFHFRHGWSHADAVRHTQERSNFGEGIYVSHLFTLVWSLDVCWWLARPRKYAARSPWFGRLLHGFMLFMIFCSTVVYEEGAIRWAGLLLCSGLAGWFMLRRSWPPRAGAAWATSPGGGRGGGGTGPN